MAKAAVDGLPPVAPTESVRERILSTARALFYQEGIRAVGVDTVVAKSGVAKTSLYRWFPSKDALIVAVLEEEAKDRWVGWDRNAERSDPQPYARLLAQMELVSRYVSSEKYRGCPFLNVAAQFPDPGHPARALAVRVSEELRKRIQALVDGIEGVQDPAQLTDQLMLLVEGAMAAAQVLGRKSMHAQLVPATKALIAMQQS